MGRKTRKTIDLGQIATNQNNADGLTLLLKSVTKDDVRFHRDGGQSGGRSDQHAEAIRKYIEYWNTHVLILPFAVPEEPIWSDQNADHQLQMIEPDATRRGSKVAQLSQLQPKDRFAQLAEFLYNKRTSPDILRLQTLFVKAWLNTDDQQIKQVQEILTQIRKASGGSSTSK